MVVATELLSFTGRSLSGLAEAGIFVGVVATVVVSITSILLWNALLGVVAADGSIWTVGFLEAVVTILIQLVRSIQAVVLAIATPLRWHTSAIGTLELGAIAWTQRLNSFCRVFNASTAVLW